MSASQLSPEHEQRLWRLAAELTREVQQSQGQEMRGAALGQSARKYDVDILHLTGVRLATLLDRYAPELTVVGRAGADLVWGMSLPSDAPAPDTAGAAGVPEGGWPRVGEGVVWESVRFTNFRSLRDTSLDLEDFMVLVGRNGVGKSNVLDGIFRLSQLTGRKPDIVFSGRHERERVTGRWDASGGFQLEARASGGWGFRYGSGRLHEQTPLDPPFQVQAPQRPQERLRSLAFTPLKQIFGGATYLRLDAAQLARATWSLEESPFLRHDGLGLGPVLASIAQTDRARLDNIVGQVQELVPRVEDVRTTRELKDTGSYGQQLVNGVEVRMAGVGWIPADQLSEGTLLALGLHTVLSRPSPPRVLLLDDMERGLHPATQRALVEQLLKRASPACRVVCTSHSPYILDPIPASSVRVVTSDDSGATHIHPLAAHRDWPEWQDDMTPAEFWQLVGDEDWAMRGL